MTDYNSQTCLVRTQQAGAAIAVQCHLLLLLCTSCRGGVASGKFWRCCVDKCVDIVHVPVAMPMLVDDINKPNNMMMKYNVLSVDD